MLTTSLNKQVTATGQGMTGFGELIRMFVLYQDMFITNSLLFAARWIQIRNFQLYRF